MKTNLQQRPDISAMCGPTVTVTTGIDGSIEVSFGSSQGGVWREDYAGYGWTCPACDTMRPGCRDAESAAAALSAHQRRDCTARRDGGEQW